MKELEHRKINYQEKYLEEIEEFCEGDVDNLSIGYPEHNERYFKQCFFNLQEKYDRGIISKDEYVKIQEFVKED